MQSNTSTNLKWEFMWEFMVLPTVSYLVLRLLYLMWAFIFFQTSFHLSVSWVHFNFIPLEYFLWICTRGGVGQDHVHHPFVWRNAKSFYCFSLWEKAGLRFQRILKSILHEKTMNELLVSLYTLLNACTKQLCKWPWSLTENVSECWVFYPAQVFSVR